MFTAAEYLAKRPYLYHLTVASNLPAIRRTGRLRCPAQLFREAGQPELIGVRRRGAVQLQLGADVVTVRDQAPLVPGALELTDGASLEAYVAYLNSMVYLWPGDAERPRGGAANLAAVKRVEGVVLLRMAVGAVLEVNPGVELRFGRYNAGAARVHPQLGKARRWVGFHCGAEGFAGGVGEVAEVGVEGEVVLPGSVEVAAAGGGGWSSLALAGALWHG